MTNKTANQTSLLVKLSTFNTQNANMFYLQNIKKQYPTEQYTHLKRRMYFPEVKACTQKQSQTITSHFLFRIVWCVILSADKHWLKCHLYNYFVIFTQVIFVAFLCSHFIHWGREGWDLKMLYYTRQWCQMNVNKSINTFPTLWSNLVMAEISHEKIYYIKWLHTYSLITYVMSIQ